METASLKTKMKPSNYTARSFHGVRTVSAISSIIVTGILVFFCIELKNESYKIPWTFLIVRLCLHNMARKMMLTYSQVLAASVITLVSLIFTTCIHLCTRLSPIFNLIINIPLLILWIVGLTLLGWNIYGTLAHSCTIGNWGNDDGVTVCQEFKAMFAFVVFGTLAQIAMLVVDVRARIAQTRSGRYAKMRDSTSQVKLEPYDSTHAHSNNSSIHDAPYQDTATHYRDEPGWKPGQTTNTVAGSRVGDYGDIAGGDGHQAVRLNDYYQPQLAGQPTGYSSGYGQQNTGYGHRN